MMAKFAELVAGFIVDKAAAKFELHDRADLEKFVSDVVRAELPDMAPFEALPDRIIASVNAKIDGVVGQLNGIPGQVVGAVTTALGKIQIPGFPNIFGPR